MLGAINHVAIAVQNLKESDEFWKPLFQYLGYKRTLESEALSVWESETTGSAVNFWLAIHKQPYQYRAVGLHHLAFNAANTDQVDEFYALLQKHHIEVLDKPALYDEYEPGYYALYYKDVSGFKIEFAYTPGIQK